MNKQMNGPLICSWCFNEIEQMERYAIYKQMYFHAGHCFDSYKANNDGA